LACPVSCAPEAIRIRANPLRAALHAADVQLLDIRAAVIPEADFNRALNTLGSKAAVSWTAVHALLRDALRAHPDEQFVAVIDRQGGRTRYLDQVAALDAEAVVDIREESDRLSGYDLRRAGGAATSLRFEVEAEARHLPVALASMTAKLVRELAMTRFNRFWTQRLPEVKPTAGYGTDARRWIDEVRRFIDPEETESLVRRL
ncbi:MAG: hypothetical protein VYC34_00740, partial [Planctomycetota bacterium]|nr:hypothetical protein [Planctomycetota bacterium]